jgi:HTH-type transcriptional regulator/antitoxin HigA
LYGKYNDRFWFTFFHEAAHILLHDKNEIFLDDLNSSASTAWKEQEADEWARNFLIPLEKYNERVRYLTEADEITQFSNEIGIHTGIVVGRLQHDEHLGPNRFHKLKEKYGTNEKGNLINQSLVAILASIQLSFLLAVNMASIGIVHNFIT